MTTFKQLCVELYSIFETYDDESNLGGIYADLKGNNNDILDRAAAALNKSTPYPNKRQEALLAIDTAVADGRLSAEVAVIVREAFNQRSL